MISHWWKWICINIIFFSANFPIKLGSDYIRFKIQKKIPKLGCIAHENFRNILSFNFKHAKNTRVGNNGASRTKGYSCGLSRQSDIHNIAHLIP